MIDTAGKSRKSYFFLLSFLPQIVFWHLERNYTLQIAVLGSILVAFLEIFLEKIFTKSVHNLSKLNIVLIICLGFLSYQLNNGLWIKLNPAIVAILCGLFLFWLFNKNKKIDVIHPRQTFFSLAVKNLTSHMGWFFLTYGLIIALFAFYSSTTAWLIFKAIGLYFLLLCFFMGELFWLRFSQQKLSENLSNS